MTRLFGITSIVVVAALSSSAWASASLVSVCHPTGGGEVKTLNVAPAAVIAHLGHGDYYPPVWYADADGDGYGDDLVTTTACVAPEGTVGVGGDMDDTDPTVYPGAPDVCDGVDNDGDDSFDEDALEGAVLVARIGTQLWTFDPSDGTPAFLVDLVSADVDVTGINTLATDPLSGETYSFDKNTDQLVHVDVCTGVVTAIGYAGDGNYCGAAFGSDGTLWALDAYNDRLVTVDEATGASTLVGLLDFPLGNCGLAYDCASDTLWGLHTVATEVSPDYVFAIDPLTGEAEPKAEMLLLDRDYAASWVQAGLESDLSINGYYVATKYGIFLVDATSGEAELFAEGDMDNLGWLYPPVCE